MNLYLVKKKLIYFISEIESKYFIEYYVFIYSISIILTIIFIV